MSELISEFNQGLETSNTIDRQFTPELVSKAVVEFADRKRFFSQIASKEELPLNHGDTLTKEIRIPMLNPGNTVDANVDATTAKLLTYTWYVYPSVGGVVDSEYNADDYLGANAGDVDAAIAAAKAAAAARVTALGGEALMKSGAGNIQYGDASYALASGPLAQIPEKGGVLNLLNGSSKLVSASITFHGIASKYTARSVQLDSRKKQVQTKIKDLSRATAELKEMQIMNSIVSASETNRQITSDTAITPVQMTSVDTLTYDDLELLEQELYRNDVPMDTDIITGSTNLDTKTVNNTWIVYVNREMLPTLKKMTGPGGALVWKSAETYADALGGMKGLMDGEMGRIGSFTFIMVPDLQAYRGAGALASGDTWLEVLSTGVDVEGLTEAAFNARKANRHSSGGYYDVFPMIVVGADSFVTTGIMPGNVTAQHISPKSDVHNDIYGEQGGVFSKWNYGFLNYRPERIRQILTVAAKV